MPTPEQIGRMAASSIRPSEIAVRSACVSRGALLLALLAGFNLRICTNLPSFLWKICPSSSPLACFEQASDSPRRR